MKKNLNKEILKYTSAAAAMLSTGQVAGQLQYTDIPDTTIDVNAGFYNLDLDQDGELDFTITQYVDTGAAGNTNAILIQPYTGTINRIAGEAQNNYNYPFNMQAATIIDANTKWNGAGGQFTTGYMAFVVDGQSYPNSNWVGPLTNGYLGLQLWKTTGLYYGWARLDIGADSKSFTIKDFGVNLDADSSIVVAHNLLGGVENLLETVVFCVSESFLDIDFGQLEPPVTCRLYNTAGQLVADKTSNQSTMRFSIADLPRGLYVVELEHNGLVRREKLLF